MEYKDHVIVCGYGIVGERIVEILIEHGINVVVIETDPHKVDILKEKGVPVVAGDATTARSLKEAGISDAKFIAIAMDDDAKNLFAVITAKSLNENIIIATRANDELFETKLVDAGAKFVVTPNKSASDEIFNEISKGL
ncbi:MAG: NAD-binding protein [Candidatus Micrarchaeia archaeon]